MQQDISHHDPSMNSDYRPTRYGSTDSDRAGDNKSGPARQSTSHHQNKSPYKNLMWMGMIHIPIMYVIHTFSNGYW